MIGIKYLSSGYLLIQESFYIHNSLKVNVLEVQPKVTKTLFFIICHFNKTLRNVLKRDDTLIYFHLHCWKVRLLKDSGSVLRRESKQPLLSIPFTSSDFSIFRRYYRLTLIPLKIRELNAKRQVRCRGWSYGQAVAGVELVSTTCWRTHNCRRARVGSFPSDEKEPAYLFSSFLSLSSPLSEKGNTISFSSFVRNNVSARQRRICWYRKWSCGQKATLAINLLVQVHSFQSEIKLWLSILYHMEMSANARETSDNDVYKNRCNNL